MNYLRFLVLACAIAFGLNVSATAINPPPVITKVTAASSSSICYRAEYNGFNRCVSAKYVLANDLRVRHWYSYNVAANMDQFTDTVVPAGTYKFWLDGADHLIMQGAGNIAFPKHTYNLNRYGTTGADCYLLQFLDPSVSVKMDFVLPGTYSGAGTTIVIPVFAVVSGTVTFSSPTSIESFRVRPVRISRPVTPLP